jgi:hypothetical protein
MLSLESRNLYLEVEALQSSHFLSCRTMNDLEMNKTASAYDFFFPRTMFRCWMLQIYTDMLLSHAFCQIYKHLRTDIPSLLHFFVSYTVF